MSEYKTKQKPTAQNLTLLTTHIVLILCTTTENYNKYWKCVDSDVIRHQTVQTLFKHNFKIETWIDFRNDTLDDIFSKQEEEIKDWIRHVGDDVVEWAIAKRRIEI